MKDRWSALTLMRCSTPPAFDRDGAATLPIAERDREVASPFSTPMPQANATSLAPTQSRWPPTSGRRFLRGGDRTVARRSTATLSAVNAFDIRPSGLPAIRSSPPILALCLRLPPSALEPQAFSPPPSAALVTCYLVLVTFDSSATAPEPLPFVGGTSGRNSWGHQSPPAPPPRRWWARMTRRAARFRAGADRGARGG